MHDHSVNESTTPSSTPTAGPEPRTGPHVILVPGFWLGAWAWEQVEPVLRSAGLAPHAVTLPGLDGSSTADVTLDDHVEAVLDLADQLDDEVVLVGHSGGGLVVQCAVDRRPGRFSRAVYVDTGPLLDGVSLRPDAVVDVPLPSWDELVAEGSSIDGMDDAALAAFRRRAVAHPAGVAASPIRLSDDARLDVPASVICTSLSSELLQQLIAAGQMPSELPAVRTVRYVDLPTGHWPMFSRPDDLGVVLVEEILVSGP